LISESVIGREQRYIEIAKELGMGSFARQGRVRAEELNDRVIELHEIWYALSVEEKCRINDWIRYGEPIVNIEPLPPHLGVGFCMRAEPIAPKMFDGYRFEQVGPFYNYHFTKERFSWPFAPVEYPSVTLDGFSPNLNKRLHVGHLRNLVLASSLRNILGAKAVGSARRVTGHCRRRAGRTRSVV
jgi:hypothetical protein